MGSADVVPGVSGGTIALVLGIYERLIDTVSDGARALGSLVRLDFGGFVFGLKSVDWRFLLPLVIGIVVAVLTLSHTIGKLLEDHPLRMAAVFFGLVLGSILVTSRELLPNGIRLTALVATAVMTFFLLGLGSGPVEDPALWVFFGSGAIAICAMILPGISGSFILLMMGMYHNVLGAVNARDWLSVGVFTVGTVVGLSLFSTLLSKMMHGHPQKVLAVLIGLMVGSLRVLWPWPNGTDGPQLATPAGDVLIPIALAVVGLVGVLVIAAVARADEGHY